MIGFRQFAAPGSRVTDRYGNWNDRRHSIRLDMTLSRAFGLLTILLFVVAGGVLCVFAIRRSDQPSKILLKVALTVLIVLGFGVFIGPILWSWTGAFIGIPLATIAGLIIAFMWRQHIANLIASPFEALFTGGHQEADPEPFYSIAQSKIKRQRIDEAIEKSWPRCMRTISMM